MVCHTGFLRATPHVRELQLSDILVLVAFMAFSRSMVIPRPAFRYDGIVTNLHVTGKPRPCVKFIHTGIACKVSSIKTSSSRANIKTHAQVNCESSSVAIPDRDYLPVAIFCMAMHTLFKATFGRLVIAGAVSRYAPDRQLPRTATSNWPADHSTGQSDCESASVLDFQYARQFERAALFLLSRRADHAFVAVQPAQ